MEATILSWRIQNILTIMVMILVIGFAWLIVGQGVNRWQSMKDD